MTNKMLLVVILTYLYGFGNSFIIIPQSPPKPWQAALMARYIVHNTDWASLATISTQDAIKGFPFASIISMSDGPMINSTGIPYLYVTPLDTIGQDIEKDNRVTLVATLAETDYCKNKNLDPEDPRCARVFLTGKYVKISKSSPEYKFGQECLFARHPVMKTWPTSHNFYVAKISPIEIQLFDNFGGIKHVTVKDYFNANISSIINADVHFTKISIVEIISV